MRQRPWHIQTDDSPTSTRRNDVSGRSRVHGLVFINTTDPNTDPEEARRLVRSCATSFRHREQRRKAKNRIASKKRQNALQSQPSSDGSSDGSTSVEGYTTLFFTQQEGEHHGQTAGKSRILLLDGGHTDPFDSYPVPTEPWFSWVLNYYRTVQLPPGLSLVQESEAEGQKYISWQLREAMAEPSFFYMQILNACTPLLVQGRISHSIVLWLRATLIVELNHAIGDPNRACSTPVLLTVASIALHERLYGDATLAIEVHGKAFATMLALRGGLLALNLPRIALKLVRWTETVLSSSEAGKSTDYLLAAWASDDLRQRHPGYEETAD